MNTTLFQRIHNSVWAFRAYMDTHSPWITPPQYQSLRFCVTESSEILDARQRESPEFARNNNKDKNTTDECGDFVLMGVSALGKDYKFTVQELGIDLSLSHDELIDEIGWCAANALHFFNIAQNARSESPFLNNQWVSWTLKGLAYAELYVGDSVEQVVIDRMRRILGKYCKNITLEEIIGVTNA